MRPTLRFLDESLIERIVSEARDILGKLGVEIHNREILSMLSDHGAKVDGNDNRAFLSDAIIDKAFSTVPGSFKLYDQLEKETHNFKGDRVYFTPGSAAIQILDYETQSMRKPDTADYIRYAKLVSGLENLASQSTALIPADVHERLSDSYRLYLSLLYCDKPVVTGAFTVEAFEVMKDLLVAVRGSREALEAKPLSVFSCCPTSPIKWSDVTSQNLVDCARHRIPVEYISMPLSGFMAPVTLVGTLVEHTAETMSGVVITQLTRPGAPALYGGSPAAFDVRYETTPMGAVETMMIDCAYNEIGKYLGMPTQAYVSLSDAKLLDAQAGLETSMGATLGALAGVNNISGPGMLDFESCQSLEKLVLDNEICGSVARLIQGIEPKEDFPALPIFEELLDEKHLLIAKHTRRYLREEHYFPSTVIDRANRSRWEEGGSLTLGERSHRVAEEVLTNYVPTDLADDVKMELTRLMAEEGRRHGMERLPDQNL
jgi:trimethylamine--corrinoid protein Co-methyltransferase